MQVCASVCTDMCTCACVCACVFVSVFVNVFVNLCVCVCLCACDVCTCVFVCVRVCVTYTSLPFPNNASLMQVDNTDAEGRLILADALCYAHSFNPKAIVDLATLTGAIDVALGNGAAGVFTNSQSLWEQLHKVLLDKFK